MLTLTNKLIREGASKSGNGFSRAQIEALGVTWPARKGWLRGLIGQQVTEEQYARFKALRKVKGTPALPKPAKTSPKPRIVRSMEFTDDAGNDMVHVQIDLTAADAAKLIKFLGCSISC